MVYLNSVTANAKTRGCPWTRITKTKGFDRVFAGGRRVFGRSFTLVWQKAKDSTPAYGYAVSKKNGNAVKRNYIKRRIRAYFMTKKQLPALNMVVLPRPVCLGLGWDEFCQELDHLLDKADALG